MPTSMAEYDPTRDPDHEMHNDFYSGWADTHDYDPRWDYSDELRPHWQQHPLVQEAQTRLNSHTPYGRVFAADLQPYNGVGMYIHGTGSEEPVILVDPQQHERHAHPDFPNEASEQMTRTVDHEYRHALQDSEQGPDGPNFSEDDAESWRPTSNIAEDFKGLLPKIAKDERPFEYLWSFDPDKGEVHVTPQKTDHPADHPTFKTFAKHITHPERIDGFAVAIKDGWRIFTADFQEPDPFIMKRVKDALAGKHPAPPLPNVRYHGDPHG